jgi:NADPH-dependent F420 reductase
MEDILKIAILGGTGNEGAGLGFRWAAAGHDIIIGSRSAERAAQAAEKLRAGLPAGSGLITGRENTIATQEAEIIVLSVPYEAQTATLDTVAPVLAEKLLITVVAPLGTPKGRVWAVPGGSAAEEAQRQLGESVSVVAAFQSISAEHLQDLDHDIDSDVLVIGDRKADRQVAVDLAADAGMRGVHAGPLQNAPVIEGLAAVMIAINVRYKMKDAGLRITGL